MHFESWQDYQSFSRHVKYKRRYIFDDKVDHFLDIVSATSKKRKKLIKKETYLCRAQKGSDTTTYKTNTDEEIGVACPYPVERMKPFQNRAKEGRANPKGIPFLYLSDDKETAMAEVRPWVGAIISVGIFKIKRQLSVVDCSIKSSGVGQIFLENPPPEIREKAVWRDINEAFSKPIDKNEDRSEYVPTQVLAELFRDIGYDGIAYKSLFGKGLNIVLFELDDAVAEKGSLYKVKSLQLDFDANVSPRNSRIYKS